MRNLFKKIFHVNSRHNNHQHTRYSGEMINVKKPFYIDGKWALKVSCTPEYSMANDDFRGGCWATYVITEDELSSGSCLWRNNAYFGWKCKYCGDYHVVTDYMIPDEIKDKVFYREHPEKLGKVVNFNDYKRRKGKI